MEKQPFKPADDAFFDELNVTNRKRMSEELFVKLRNGILDGTLPGGYVFPNENELCKRLDIGRSTLREAYAPLETMNLIRRTKSGTYVNDESVTRNAMNFDIIAKNADPVNIIHFREILEVAIAEDAARKATAADVAELARIVGLMKKSKNDVERLTLFDYEFHSYLAKITGNELLMITLSAVRLSYENFVHEVFNRGLIPQSIEDHSEIIEALRVNDPGMAKKTMRKHLRHIKKVALQE
ncbi:MAG TPA: FCD domain-containing protein [Anaerovoracaceae bacterium]|nr:FCD domain-containing protein [Anaerovoracaceae bacterium]